MSRSRLHELSEHGQSVWIDSLSREWLETGELQRMLDEDAVVGVTSNPTIFQKAMSEGDWYDEQLREVLPEVDEDKEVFYRLAVRDIQAACDVLRPVWDGGKGQDGYVSMEVDPDLAYDRDETIAEATRLKEWIDRPNLLVKIPATEPGLGAIEECIARGNAINVTLIFSLARHEAVAEAYIRGLERLVESGGDPKTVASVASFFVSRVDTEADKRLEAIGTDAGPGAARQARDRQRKARLPELQADLLRRALGAARSRRRDEAALPVGLHLGEEPGLPRRDVRRGADRPGDREHDAEGDDRRLPGPRGRRRHPRADLEGARRLFEQLAEVGVDYDDVSETLEREGVQKFSDSFRELLDGVRAKRAELVPA